MYVYGDRVELIAELTLANEELAILRRLAEAAGRSVIEPRVYEVWEKYLEWKKANGR